MDNKKKQLNLEIALLLSHIPLSVEEKKVEAIQSIEKELKSIRKNLDKLEADKAASLINDLLKVIKYPHTIVFLNDKDTKSQLLKNNNLGHIVANCLNYTYLPLKEHPLLATVSRSKDALLELTNLDKLSIDQGIELMQYAVNLATSLTEHFAFFKEEKLKSLAKKK
jgi:hypothetical protein